MRLDRSHTISTGVLAALFLVLTCVDSATAQNNSNRTNRGYQSPQSIDGSKLKQKRETPAETDPTKSKPDDKRVFEVLFREMDNMIPGDFEPGSDLKKSIEDAVKAFQQRDAGQVESILKELSGKTPGLPPTDLLLATLSYAVQDTNSGLVLLERAAVNHPDYPGIYSAFARLAINQGRISDALALLEKCQRKIEANEGLTKDEEKFFNSQCLDGLTDVAMRQGRLEDARSYLERQRDALPDNPKVLMVSAELEFKEDNIDASKSYLQTLKKKYPSTRTPETILASWFSRSGKAEEAEKWIREAAKKYPDDPQVQLEFASWAIEKENFPMASSAIIKAEKATNESLASRNLKGKIAFANQSYNVAESHFQALAENQPNNFDAVNMYALCLIESEDPQKQGLARMIATRNFRALPDNVVAQAAMGFIELRLGQTDQAKAIITRAAQTAGAAPEIDFFLASVLAKVGETQQAKIVLDGALKHKGLFLYRKSAQALKDQLENASDALPSPGDK